jgi:hypothetical protein
MLRTVQEPKRVAERPLTNKSNIGRGHPCPGCVVVWEGMRSRSLAVVRARLAFAGLTKVADSAMFTLIRLAVIA